MQLSSALSLSPHVSTLGKEWRNSPCSSFPMRGHCSVCTSKFLNLSTHQLPCYKDERPSCDHIRWAGTRYYLPTHYCLLPLNIYSLSLSPSPSLLPSPSPSSPPPLSHTHSFGVGGRSTHWKAMWMILATYCHFLFGSIKELSHSSLLHSRSLHSSASWWRKVFCVPRKTPS